MFDGRFRTQVDAAVKPVGQAITRAGISADMITGVGIVMSVAAAVAIGFGALNLGVLLVLLTGVPDLLDGAVAKASGKSSQRGAFFDSVSDRITDGLLFTALAFYFASEGRSPWVVVLPVLGYVTASWVSYVRAKADALGFDATGGLVERAERIIMLAVGLLFGGAVLIGVLIAIVVLNLITAGQRFVKVWRQATDATPALAAARRPRRAPRATRTSAERRAARAERRRQTAAKRSR